jgi:putative glutamine amidotransferase
MAIPLIGITTYRTYNRSGNSQICVNEAYITSVAEAGGVPILIPLGLPKSELDALLQSLDGILFSGGGDVQPERYGSQPNQLVKNVDLDRDRVEVHLFGQARSRKLPFLGVCRGIQVINVGQGGSLYEDIQEQHPGSIRHQSPDAWPRNRLAHSVKITPNSKLYQILGHDEIEVNSLHHQAIKQLAPGFKISAIGLDGIIEAIELTDYPYGIGVQWHPEWMQAHLEMRELFQSFIMAAENNHNQ